MQTTELTTKTYYILWSNNAVIVTTDATQPCEQRLSVGIRNERELAALPRLVKAFKEACEL